MKSWSRLHVLGKWYNCYHENYRGETLFVAAHTLVEAYAVLTRLPLIDSQGLLAYEGCGNSD
jgi:hypothetical protein